MQHPQEAGNRSEVTVAGFPQRLRAYPFLVVARTNRAIDEHSRSLTPASTNHQERSRNRFILIEAGIRRKKSRPICHPSIGGGASVHRTIAEWVAPPSRQGRRGREATRSLIVRDQLHRNGYEAQTAKSTVCGQLHPHGAASCRFATRPVLRTRPGHPSLDLPLITHANYACTPSHTRRASYKTLHLKRAAPAPLHLRRRSGGNRGRRSGN